MVEGGVVPDLLLNGKYGHALHVWDLRKRRHLQTLDLGAEHQIALELRPAHDPTRPYGFVNCVVSLKDLSASVWLWHHTSVDPAAPGEGEWRLRKVLDIPAEPATADQLPPALQPFGAVPPLVTDINLSVDDQTLYVSCWGTGAAAPVRRLRPLPPPADGRGAPRRDRLPRRPPQRRPPQRRAADGGAEPGREARVRHQLPLRVLGRPVLPGGDRGLDGQAGRRPRAADCARTSASCCAFEGERPHQVRLDGGDASSNSYCFP